MNTQAENWRKLYEELAAKNYDQLFDEYQKLRSDYNELINQNELLQEFNAQMYQEKFQDKDVSNDVAVQRSPEPESTQEDVTNDWNDQFSAFDFPTGSSDVPETNDRRSSND